MLPSLAVGLPAAHTCGLLRAHVLSFSRCVSWVRCSSCCAPALRCVHAAGTTAAMSHDAHYDVELYLQQVASNGILMVGMVWDDAQQRWVLLATAWAYREAAPLSRAVQVHASRSNVCGIKALPTREPQNVAKQAHTSASNCPLLSAAPTEKQHGPVTVHR